MSNTSLKLTLCFGSEPHYRTNTSLHPVEKKSHDINLEFSTFQIHRVSSCAMLKTMKRKHFQIICPTMNFESSVTIQNAGRSQLSQKTRLKEHSLELLVETKFVCLYQKHEHHCAIPRISVLPEREVKKLKALF